MYNIPSGKLPSLSAVPVVPNQASSIFTETNLIVISVSAKCSLFEDLGASLPSRSIVKEPIISSNALSKYPLNLNVS